MKKYNLGFSLIEIIVSLLLFAVLIVSIFPIIYLISDISSTNILNSKSNILLNNSVAMLTSVASDSIVAVHGHYLTDDYNTIENFEEFKRNIYIYNEDHPATDLKRIHIITSYMLSNGEEFEKETVFLR
jgi:prepilin-type N-terminal cleavage/methylation domain-containing protein